MELKESISVLKGVGPKKAAALEKLGIKTIEDLMLFFPRDYQDRRCVCPIGQLEDGMPVVIRGKIDLVMKDPYRRGRKQILRLLASDESGKVEILFFQARYLSD